MGGIALARPAILSKVFPSLPVFHTVILGFKPYMAFALSSASLGNKSFSNIM